MAALKWMAHKGHLLFYFVPAIEMHQIWKQSIKPVGLLLFEMLKVTYGSCLKSNVSVKSTIWFFSWKFDIWSGLWDISSWSQEAAGSSRLIQALHWDAYNSSQKVWELITRSLTQKKKHITKCTHLFYVVTRYTQRSILYKMEVK